MREHTKKHPIEEARFRGHPAMIARLRELARDLGAKELDTIPASEVFPELATNRTGAALRGLRYREDLTQAQLAERSGIPQRHISEMENGKRGIGKDNARKLAAVLNADYRLFL
ncbi:MAG: helix-turn-helix transcriptional regulator [Trichloromonas sp.]|jgi:DNA-binding XRE family transcriptional regulator|nr:helix-turn-helix transcriptional regulator [Trichloromonas sp.]